MKKMIIPVGGIVLEVDQELISPSPGKQCSQCRRLNNKELPKGELKELSTLNHINCRCNSI